MQAEKKNNFMAASFSASTSGRYKYVKEQFMAKDNSDTNILKGERPSLRSSSPIHTTH
jgi:hypothetical protein